MRERDDEWQRDLEQHGAHDLKPLAQRLREAADTCEEVNPEAYWTPTLLRKEAQHVEDEDQEAYERNTMIDELAREITALTHTAGITAHLVKEIVATGLIESGWRKGEPE